MQRPPAEPGMAEAEVDTPALLVDLDAMEENFDRMAAFCAKAGVRLRPHAKTHKSPLIARWQAARGAVGQCVQKVAEAEILAWGGVSDILVSNEVVSEGKLARLAALARITKIALCADHPEAVRRIEAAARNAGVILDVLVEIDVGGGRCGVEPGAAAVELAAMIDRCPHLAFGGLQAYHGRAQHLRTLAERRAAVDVAAKATRLTIHMLGEANIECQTVGGTGTGTFALEAGSGVYTELQAGSYLFMDADYALNENGPPFHQALFVLAQVMSAPRPDLAVLDCGHKGVAIDSGLPMVFARPGVDYVGASDEHGTLRLGAGASPLAIGEKLRLVPGHCDPTVDRYDWYVGVRSGRVELVWPVAARGAMT